MVPPWQHSRQRVPSWPRCAPGAAQSLDEVPLGHADVAFLQYTGGTTGVAKGAVLTHGNMVANVLQVAAWIARDLQDGEETVVIPLPLYHVYALTSNLVFMKLGAHSVLITNPRDMPAFIKTLKEHRFTAIIGVNTLYSALIDAPGFARGRRQPAQADLGRRHGGAARGRAEAGRRPPACRSSRATGCPRLRRS